MKYNDMRKPLVQSVLVILAVLVVIGFVAGSGAESFWGGILSIIKGAIYSVLFAFALVLSLIFSVAMLIAIFLGAVSIYSSEKAKEMYANVKHRSTDLYYSWTKNPSRKHHPPSSTQDAKTTGHSVSVHREETQFATADSLLSLEQKVSSELVDLKQAIDTFQTKSGSLDASFASLEDTLSSLPGADTIQRIEQLEEQQEKMDAKLDECLQTLEKIVDTSHFEEVNKKLDQKITGIQGEITTVTKDLKELRASFAKPDPQPQEPVLSDTEEEPRIFTYLEKDADKKQLAKLVAEAVEKNMTYAEINSFLSKSLPKKVDTIIKEHPSLTKEYIRECKNR
jgi:uncharacterized protein (DUF2267 family)